MLRSRFCSAFLLSCLLFGSAGCGNNPPEATGEPYEPSPEMKDMAGQMMESYKAGNVNNAK